MMHHSNNDDAMNKIPLKSASGLDDEEKNGGEFIHDTAAAEEARREQRRTKLLNLMKKLTIVIICFIGFALMGYVIFSLCFTDDSNSDNNNNSNHTANMSALASIASHGANQFTQTATDAAATTASDATTVTTRAITSAAAAAAAEQEEATATTLSAAVAIEPAVEQSAASVDDVATTTNIDATATTTTTPPTTTTTTMATKKPTPPPKFEDIAMAEAKKFESKLGVYREAAVCSDREVCSRIGSHILSSEGSAVDAAIAVMLCTGITTMQSMGIGGGMMMNIYIHADKHGHSVDAREVAPYAVDEDDYRDMSKSVNGGLAIAVPGELMGYHTAHKRFGKLPWRQLVEPSIKLCREGYYMSAHQLSSLLKKQDNMKDQFAELVKDKNHLFNHFMNATTGEFYPLGTKLTPPKELCDTYEMLAANGALDFYNGSLAKLVEKDLQDLGSKIDLYDLETYMADLVSSVTMQLGDGMLYAMPPASSGTVVANILSILEGYNFNKTDLDGDENAANTIHRMAEAMKFGFAKRWELGDVRFNDVRELVSKLTDPSYSMNLRLQINDSAVLETPEDYGAQYSGTEDQGTSQIVVVAPNGDAVSVTSSINDYFGCGHFGKRTGIIFNSAMNDFAILDRPNMFALPPSANNVIEPRKRPMSSMSPMILTDRNGDVQLALGAAGGTQIISAIVEVAARVLWFGEDIKEAIDAPRFHHQLIPNKLIYQKDGFSVKLLHLLGDKGQLIAPSKEAGSVVCGIARNATAIYANADYRKHGGIAGY